jgi:hypothetical protein
MQQNSDADGQKKFRQLRSWAVFQFHLELGKNSKLQVTSPSSQFQVTRFNYLLVNYFKLQVISSKYQVPSYKFQKTRFNSTFFTWDFSLGTWN